MIGQSAFEERLYMFYSGEFTAAKESVMLKDLVLKNRSYRGYDENVSISRETLESFVECARLCPSSVNKQPLKYYLVSERELVRKVQGLTRWARALPELQLPHPGHCPTAFIVICQDSEIDPNLNRYMKDVGIVAQTMLLAAVEQELGGCMIGNFTAGEVKEVLNLKPQYHPLLIVAFGKPDETIVLTDIPESGDTSYYRDSEDVHYVPKRRLEEEIIG